jgi:nickel/cobalt transporter (NicO) family protein
LPAFFKTLVGNHEGFAFSSISLASLRWARHNESMRYLFAVAALCLLVSTVGAHPVPKDNHDRTIVVRLQKSDTADRLRVRVEYRLEVDEGTIIDKDMKPYRDDYPPLKYRGEPMKFYAKFAEIYAPIYAAHLVMHVDNKLIETFRCLERTQRLEDEAGKGLGHLRCDFVYETTIEIPLDRKTAFSFYEKNYWGEDGDVVLSVVNETGLAIEGVTAPEDVLRKRARENPEAGDDERLRRMALTFAPQVAPKETSAVPPRAEEPAPARESHHSAFDLRRLIFHTGYGFWLIMLLAFLFGAAHALTPGHGKTLVAAYLVGARGTVWHALYLGLVTTLTHTGVVMAIALTLMLLPEDMQQTFRTWIQNGLGLVMGLMVTCMGFWLLLQRLAGRADHIHLDGGHHHGEPPQRTLSWWGVTLLGMTGGMIPCWDAVGVLGMAVSADEIQLAFPAVLIFSAGLAVVLVVIGVLVVQVPRFVEARGGGGRVLNALPIMSAILVTMMGLWLCYEGVHGK